MIRPVILSLFLSGFAGGVRAQVQQMPETLRIFLDCQNTFCDLDYYRREVGFVSYVRDRQDADVHILVATQATGGGREYSVNFIGLRDYEGRVDTLVFATSSTDTQDETRAALRDALKMGLMPYVFGTPAADRIQITFGTAGPQGPPRPSAEDDPWDYWVFTTRANGDINLFESIKVYSINGFVSANRVTEDWKITISTNGGFREERFSLTDSVLVTTTKSWSGNALVVRSVTDGVSFGARARGAYSTFRNEDLVLRFAPAVEFNLYPYSESASQSLTLLYDVGINRFDYGQITLFDKTEEVLFDHSMTLSLNMVQPWGSSNFSLSGTSFLNDFAQHRISLGGSMNIRIVRGLNFNMFGQVARIKNQRNIARGGATDDEILTRLRQLQTDYQVFSGFGLSYRFGSIFNNVTNPRFGGGEGGFFFFGN